jgi:hypothetical protein
MESGDVHLLEHIMSQIRHPATAMREQIQDAVRLITSALAYCYDVPKMPSGFRNLMESSWRRWMFEWKYLPKL